MAFALGPVGIAAGQHSVFDHGDGWRETVSSRADAFAAYKSGKFATAMRLLAPFARSGDAEAETAIGIILRGLGELGVAREAVAKDLPAAAERFKHAALSREPRAMIELAQMREQGEGLPADLMSAYKYYASASLLYPPGAEQTRAIAGALRVRAQIEIALAQSAPGDLATQTLAAAWRDTKIAELPLPSGVTATATPPDLR